MKNLITSLLLVLFATTAFASSKICYFEPNLSTNPASLAFGDQASFDFGYETDEPGGVRIFIRPMSNGQLTAGYAASGSPIYAGSGTASASFTISSGTHVLVNEVRIQVYNADQSSLLLEFYKPVQIHFSNNAVPNIQLVSGTRGSFLHQEQYNINFDYKIQQAGGARIFFRPMTNGSLTPAYGASGSPIYTGTGSSSAYFTISSGLNVEITAVRMQVYNADQSQLLYEMEIPVYLKFSNTAIRNITEPGSIYFYHNDQVNFSFDYGTLQPDGIRVFFRPMSDGASTPYYAAAGSPLYPSNNGNGNTYYTVTSGNTIVDQTRITVYNSDQSQLLLEYLLPADYVTGDFDFYNFTACPPSEARMANGTPIDMSFTYNNMTGSSARLFIRPFSNGSLSPGYAASGSPEYTPGSGSSNAYFTISSGDVTVDALRVLVTNNDQSATLMEFFIPVHYVFGNALSPAFEASNAHNAEVSIAPNPSAELATLSYQMNASGPVQVQVFNLAGQLVQSHNDMYAQADQVQQLELNAQHLPNGVYLIKIHGNGASAAQKWVITR